MILVYLALLGRILLLGYEKILVKKLVNNGTSEITAFLYFFIASCTLVPTLFFTSFPRDFSFLIPLSVSSFLYAIAYLFYVKAFSLGEVSLVAPLYNLNLVFLLILTTLFLGEKLTLTKVCGVLLILYGASLLGQEKHFTSSILYLFRNRAPLYMLLSSFFIACGRTIDGYAISHISPIIYAFGINLGISLFILFYLVFTKRVGDILPFFIERLSGSIQLGFINSYSYLLLLFAFTRIDVSIAEPFSMLSIVVTVIFAYIIFKEEIRKRLIASSIMVGGAWLLFL